MDMQINKNSFKAYYPMPLRLDYLTGHISINKSLNHFGLDFKLSLLLFSSFISFHSSTQTLI